MISFAVIRSLLLSLFSKQELVLIDLGSSFTRIFCLDKEIYNQPTCIAVHKKTGSVVAIGNKALNLLGKAPATVEINFPVQYGEVANTIYLEYYLTAIFGQLFKENKIHKSLLGMFVKISVPSCLSPAKEYLLRQVMKSVGVAKIEFVKSGLAISHKIALNDKKLKDVCIIDFGASKTEIAIFSIGELTFSKIYRFGGIHLTESLQKIIRNKHQCVVGWQIAEQAKKEIGNITNTKNKIAIRGKDLITQAGKTIIINNDEIKDEFVNSFAELLDNIEQFISLLPSEVAVSILDKGIYITGGCSQIKGIDQMILDKFKCEVFLSLTPEKDAILGLK